MCDGRERRRFVSRTGSRRSATYVAQFRQHIAQLQAHLTGTDAEPLLPSYIPPTGYWTAEEKGLFFHALSVHSRFRPDLIAACVKTKTILDVCAYIDTLHRTLSRNNNLPSLRPKIECANEVSDSWVQWEERNAEELVAIEPKWEEETLERRHEEMSARDIDVENIMSAENVNPTSLDPAAWESDIQRIWRQETALKRLDFRQLKVLEGFLRPSESGTDKDADEAQTEDQECPGIPDFAALPSPVSLTARTLPNSTPIMIDPVLPSSKSVPVQVLPQQSTSTIEVTERSSLLPEPSSLQAIIPTALQSIALSRPSPKDKSPSPGGDKVMDTGPSDLTPSSRRRIQKRLYMRRKRAEQRGEKVISNVAKLRPGRKVREPKPPRQRSKSLKTKDKTPSWEESDDNASMDMDASPQTIPITLPLDAKAPRVTAEAQAHNTGSPIDSQEHNETHNTDEDDDHQKRHNKSGLTQPYKIKKNFIANGIDGNTLVKGNLNLFHLSTLGRFMECVKCLYAGRSSC